MIGIAREHLALSVADTLELLEELENELQQAQANKVEPYVLLKFQKRLNRLDRLIQLLLTYDRQVQQYLKFNPENRGDLVERLEIARHYVASIGGDWSTVVWGKRSDYR
jgi:ATP-dependent protease HslVU (ClpYQ) peptidase subunit